MDRKTNDASQLMGLYCDTATKLTVLCAQITDKISLCPANGFTRQKNKLAKSARFHQTAYGVYIKRPGKPKH